MGKNGESKQKGAKVKMSDKDFVKEYLEDFSSLVKHNDKIVEKIISLRDILVQA